MRECASNCGSALLALSGLLAHQGHQAVLVPLECQAHPVFRVQEVDSVLQEVHQDLQGLQGRQVCNQDRQDFKVLPAFQVHQEQWYRRRNQ